MRSTPLARRRSAATHAATAACGRGLRRRQLLASLVSGSTLGLAGCAGIGTSPARARVLVVGAGYGGTTAARYLRLLSDDRIDVTLVEPNPQFVSCPVSNLVVAGAKSMADITRSYDNLVRRHGVRLVRDRVRSVDTTKRLAVLGSGDTLAYDRLVLAPGIDFDWQQTEGLQAANAEGQVLHAWKAGPETMALRRQLEAMPDGGVYAIAIPEVPYRCPPAPYERASLVAAYFQRAKPRSKVLVLDANPDVASKGPLFKRAWAEQFPGRVEYLPEHRVAAVDGRTRTAKFEVQDDVRADVLNVLPVMSAGTLAQQTGLANANRRWCQVHFLDFESTVAPHVHVIGDAIQIASGMSKSGHTAHAQAKVAAAAIVAELQGLEVDPHPVLSNTCISYVDAGHVAIIASEQRYETAARSFVTAAGHADTSAAIADAQGRLIEAWSSQLWADMLG